MYIVKSDNGDGSESSFKKFTSCTADETICLEVAYYVTCNRRDILHGEEHSI